MDAQPALAADRRVEDGDLDVDVVVRLEFVVVTDFDENRFAGIDVGDLDVGGVACVLKWVDEI